MSDAATKPEVPPCPLHGDGFICDHAPEEDYADEWA